MTPAFQAIISFTVAAGLLTMTPGLDTALILRTATVKGMRPAYAVALGTSTGCILWCILVSVGLGALLLVSELFYDLLRLLGAFYLLYLGTQMLLKSRNKGNASNAEAISTTPLTNSPMQRWFYQGFCNNLLNPKVGVFYITFLPQFIPKGANIAAFGTGLGCIHGLEGLLWGALLISATRPLSGWLKQPHVTKSLDRLTGSILMGFGLKLALEPRH